MINSSVVNKYGNNIHVLSSEDKKRFFVNLWSKQSSIWLQKFPVSNRQIIAAYFRYPDQAVVTKNHPVAPPHQPTFIPHSTQFIRLDLRRRLLISNHCRSMPTAKNTRPLKKVSAKMKIRPRWSGRSLRAISPVGCRMMKTVRAKPRKFNLRPILWLRQRMTRNRPLSIANPAGIGNETNHILARNALTTSLSHCHHREVGTKSTPLSSISPHSTKLQYQNDNNFQLLIDVDCRPQSSTHIKRVHSYSCHKYLLSPTLKVAEQLSLEDIKKIIHHENQESQESEGEYSYGGYMPIEPGYILRGTYKVCRKLGFGHFSTVWLCRNIYYTDTIKYVAVKVCKSEMMFCAVAKDEIRLLEETRSTCLDHPGYKHIVQMVDTFEVTSSNGVHTAIAMEIMGPSLLHLLIQSEFRGIQISGVRNIIKQVLLGLTYLHGACRIIHTDIKPENILIKVNESYIKDMAERAEKFTELGIDMPRSYVASTGWTEPAVDEANTTNDICTKFEEKRARSYPYDVFLAELCNFRERHSEPSLTAPMWVNSNIEIKIADMGNACWENRHFASEIQTRQYRALEVIMGAGYSFPADMWSVGCLAFELATAEMLFNPKGSNPLDVDVDHLSLIWETLGGIPKYITETGSEARRYFKGGLLRHISNTNLRIWKVEDVLVEKYKWKRVDAIPFAGFIECLIEPDPVLRLTSSGAVIHEWIDS